MSEWKSYSVGQVASWQGGFAFPSSEFVEAGVPIVRMSDLKSGRLDLVASEKVPPSYLQQLQSFALRDGDFLMGMTGSLENYAIVSQHDLPALLNQRVGRLVRKSDAISYAFLIHVLLTESFKRHAEKVAAGAAQKNISPSQIEEYRFFSPVDLSEQRRIAEILGTVDEAIEQTEALIGKQQQVKAGLMHDLFTRGVTPDGHLRPARAEEPNLYKESPLGWIPKEWALMKCSEVCERITVGIVVRPTQYYVREGVPAFRSANVRETGIDPSDLVFISSEANELLAKSQVKAGDVISVRTGYPGTSAVVSPEFEGANCIDILISRPTSRLASHFMAAWINSSFGKDQVLKKQGGLAQQHFNVGDLRNLLFVIPDANEQAAVVSLLAAVTDRIAAETAHLTKLRQQKQGLMQDLLTGRVPVKLPTGPSSKPVQLEIFPTS